MPPLLDVAMQEGAGCQGSKWPLPFEKNSSSRAFKEDSPAAALSPVLGDPRKAYCLQDSTIKCDLKT